MMFYIKILLIISSANFCLAFDNEDYNINDTINQEINNYNNSVENNDRIPPTEALSDEHEINIPLKTPNIRSKNTIEDNKIIEESKYSIINILNKITAKSETISIKMNNTYKYKNIYIKSITCQKSLENRFEDRVLITIIEDDTNHNIFLGWLLSNSSLTSVNHPIYDITLTKCSN